MYPNFTSKEAIGLIPTASFEYQTRIFYLRLRKRCDFEMTNYEEDFVIKGNLIFSEERTSDNPPLMNYLKDGYLILENGKVAGIFSSMPTKYKNYKLIDYKNQLIIPGMTDLHVHAPQYPFRGLGMDLELLEWLNTNTFPEEAKYKEKEYATKAYRIFVSDLVKSTTTRACIFGTIHNEATKILMHLLEDSGLHTFVGRVNMDRNGTEDLEEESALLSFEQTKEWIEFSNQTFAYTKPILTPRFIPSCTDELMNLLKELQTSYHLPVQSHLSENLSEIEWVKELVPNSSFYGDAYRMFGMFGDDVKTVMAHCVYSSDEEVELIKKNGVFIAHCPESNLNLASGIAPIRKYLEHNINIGLGSDVAGGSSISLLQAMAYAVQVSKLYYRLVDHTKKPLTFEEVFYLATLGGGKFFGKVGTFKEGYEFDAVVINDESLLSPRALSLKERMERAMYQPKTIDVTHKYVSGHFVF